MRSFRNLPIKWKLMLMMMLTSMIAVALLGSALFFTGLVRLRHLAVEETAGLAGIIGGECAGALAAKDANAARKKLSDLAARTTIEDACLYTADGREIARYTRHNLTPRPPPPARESGEYFVGDHLELYRQIEHDGKPVGMIHLRTDTHTKRDRIKSFVGVSVVVTAILALTVLALASWLERLVFSSIWELVRIARGVTERKDFTLRAAKLSEDETGVLTDAFNKMLAIIQERNGDSRASQNRLEKRVAERTRQLEAANEQLKAEIAERMQAERALAQLNVELEARIHQRTAALVAENTERKQMQEELRASHEQLRALAARLQAAREEERTSVAREIHDVLAQELTRLKMGLVWLQRRLTEPEKATAPETLAVHVSEMSQTTDAAIRCVQEIATELRPAVLDSLGLCAAVEWHARDFCDHARIQCQVSVPEEELPVDRDVATAAFRILQESLTNVQRHAQATRVDVLLRQEAGQLILRVQDNGCGVRSEALTSSQSIGLVGMRERALLLGGQFNIWSQPGSGTTIEVRLPLSKQKNLPEGNS